MDRLTVDEYGCLLALIGKSRSEDVFTKVGGAAINSENRVLGVSYNGLKSGQDMPAWMGLEANRERKTDFFIHCESNLCSLLTRGQCKTIYLTQSPCIKCCQSIVALDVKNIIYIKEYEKCDKFKDFFDFHGIKYRQLDPKEKANLYQYLQDMNNFKELFT